MMKSLIKDGVRTIVYNLLRKRIKESVINWTEICISENDIIYFCLSSNPIISIRLSDRQYFFRECIELLPKKEFLLNRIDFFFRFIHNNDFSQMGFKQEIPIQTNFEEQIIASFKTYIYSRCSDKYFINTMLRMDKELRKIGYSIWSNQRHLSIEDIWKLGLKDLEEQYLDIAIYFIWQMRAASNIRRYSTYVRGERHSYFNAVRTMASQIIAYKMGFPNLIPESKWCMLRVGKTVLRGIISEAVSGMRGCDCIISPSVELQQRLTELHLFDLICFQQDHGPNNYNIYFKDQNIIVTAFDNDNNNTFFPTGSVNVSLAGCSPLIKHKGQINRTIFDNELVDKIIQTNTKELCDELKPFLNIWQSHALKCRIQKIKKSFVTNQYRCAFISKEEWTEENLVEELSGKFGDTYLTKLFYYSNYLLG